ncbi:hypothetical protein E8E14_005073 [Neopestalotiopsis sp. 37M]|nr:hypothetical protein E8E14_005073 [Neopestalotiopsis sp. 37M]
MEELASGGGVGGGWAMKTGHQDGMALVPVVQPSYSAGPICILEKDKKANTQSQAPGFLVISAAHVYE